MFEAVDADQANEVRALLARGIDVNTVDRDGNTLLARAAQRGNRAVFTLLLGSGARIESRNRFGETPLMYAALGGNEAIVRELLGKQVRVLAARVGQAIRPEVHLRPARPGHGAGQNQ